MVTRGSPKFNFTHAFFLIVIKIIRCSGMFGDVPECSGMFHVPGFIDGSKAVPGVSSSLLRYFIKAKTSVSKWYCSSLENLYR